MKHRRRSIVLLVTFLLSICGQFLLPNPVHAQSVRPLVFVLSLNGQLTPVLANYLASGLDAANRAGAEVVILKINTPGGTLDLLNQIVDLVRASPVPVVTYISPRGSMAASAGAIITFAGCLSAAAPETKIGSASPVGSEGEDLDTTMDRKVKEMMKTTVRTLTANRPAEAVALAESMVEEAKAATGAEAVEIGLIDFQAKNVDELLTAIDGRVVEVNGRKVTFHTAGAEVFEYQFSFIEQALQLLTNPNLVFLLLTFGLLAILIEFSTPGGWVAGFVGVVSLLLAGYGMGILSVNWFGLIFLVLSFALFILDLKAPTHGALTAAGVVSFIVGSLVLFNSVNVPGFPQVSIPLIIATGLLMGAGMAAILAFALRAQRVPVLTMQNAIVGRTGFARSEIRKHGQVLVSGELWSAELAEGQDPIPNGAAVEVVEINGIVVKVRRAE